MNHLGPANEQQIGILHPGQMGVSIGAALLSRGIQVNWAGEGRSVDTSRRANLAGLTDLGTLAKLCSRCRYLFSVCPPDQAGALAQQVALAGFNGIYIDCNAVSPSSSRKIGECFGSTSVVYIDGGIIGPPAHESDTTRLYLSGPLATEVSALFAGSLVKALVLDKPVGSASALKMAYAGWTKGSAALLMNQFALAKKENVEESLLQEWALSQPGLSEQLDKISGTNAPKAWRFVGEMGEIADTLQHVGLPRQWFEGAAHTYARLSQFKNQNDLGITEVVEALTTNQKD